MERHALTWAINHEGVVKLRAARLLGINRVTLDRKLEHYGLEVRRGTGVVTARPVGEVA